MASDIAIPGSEPLSDDLLRKVRAAYTDHAYEARAIDELLARREREAHDSIALLEAALREVESLGYESLTIVMPDFPDAPWCAFLEHESGRAEAMQSAPNLSGALLVAIDAVVSRRELAALANRSVL